MFTWEDKVQRCPDVLFEVLKSTLLVRKAEPLDDGDGSGSTGSMASWFWVVGSVPGSHASCTLSGSWILTRNYHSLTVLLDVTPNVQASLNGRSARLTA
jgi:hypothetical protein